MGGITKLRRKSRRKHYQIEPLLPRKDSSYRKLSQVILDFAQPLPDATEDEEFEDVIRFTVLCWNYSLLLKDELREELQNQVRQIDAEKLLNLLENDDCVQMLLERKRKFFPDDKRLVVDYKIVEEPDHHHLYVVSAPTDT